MTFCCPTKGQALTAGTERDEHATLACSHSCLTVCCKAKQEMEPKLPQLGNLPAPDKWRAPSSATSTEGAVGTEGRKSQELGDLGGYKKFHGKTA